MKHSVILLCVPLLTACSVFNSSRDSSAVAVAPEAASTPQPTTLPLTERQRRWWTEHRAQARNVPGHGWQVPGYPGFYSDDGARIVPPEAQVTEAQLVSARSNERKDTPVEVFLNRSKQLVGGGTNERVAKQRLAEGQALYKQKKYREAEEKFLDAAERWPGSPLAEDGLFLAAECEFFTDRYPLASKQYEGLLAKYTNSRYLDTSVQRLFAIAQYWEGVQAENPRHIYKPNFTDDTRPYTNAESAAIEVYRKVYLNHPTGPLADDAIMAIAAASFRNHNWEQADYHYTLLRNEYPTSKHQFDAHLLGLQAKFQRYEGPFYDKTALEECKKLADRLLTQFPRQLADRSERTRVEKMRAEVEGQLALRQWELAQYYQKNGHNRSATLYYGNIIKDYPESSFAKQSREQIVALGGQPPEPAPRFVWLTDLFSNTRQR